MPALAGDRVAELLGGFGLELGPGGLVAMRDLHQAEHCHIHHTSEPVAIVGWSLVSPAFARGRVPTATLGDLVWKRPAMDGREALALAALCGSELTPAERHTLAEWGSPVPFSAALDDVLDRYRFRDRFFGRTGRGEGHYDIRPIGIDPATDLVDEPGMKAWRQAYRALPAPGQMMVATILWLYRGGKDETWLKGLRANWPAAEAVIALRDSDCLADWGRLVALYPGW